MSRTKHFLNAPINTITFRTFFQTHFMIQNDREKEKYYKRKVTQATAYKSPKFEKKIRS